MNLETLNLKFKKHNQRSQPLEQITMIAIHILRLKPWVIIKF